VVLDAGEPHIRLPALQIPSPIPRVPWPFEPLLRDSRPPLRLEAVAIIGIPRLPPDLHTSVRPTRMARLHRRLRQIHRGPRGLGSLGYRRSHGDRQPLSQTSDVPHASSRSPVLRHCGAGKPRGSKRGRSRVPEVSAGVIWKIGLERQYHRHDG